MSLRLITQGKMLTIKLRLRNFMAPEAYACANSLNLVEEVDVMMGAEQADVYVIVAAVALRDASWSA